MSVRNEAVSKLFESIAVETPVSVRERARELSGRFLESSAALPLAPGDVAGSYEVLEALGSGGQAVVYRAKHRQIGRQVALKVPRREVGDRLLREAQLAARLEHPSIARVEDIQLEGAVPYMVLELCDRGSLEDVLEECPRGLPVERVREVAAAVLRALSFAHANGVIHRDVKPANILFDKNGQAKVADFGIGTMSAADGLSVSVELSQLSLLAGTPLYVAPEQENPALRANGKLDGRADLFSFGKVLFQMLTGASPRTIRPPSRLRAGLDAAWDEYVFKLLEERPEDRFPSADAALAFLPGSAGPPAAAAVAVAAAAPAKPIVVVAPRAPEARPLERTTENAAQTRARIACQVFAGIFLIGLWFAVSASLLARDGFLPLLYAGAFLTAAGFSLAESRRASRARDAWLPAAFATCAGAGLAFVGSAAGVHFSLLQYGWRGEYGGHEQALLATLFFTLPVQGVGFVLAWYGHRALAPADEAGPSHRELALLEAATATLTALLGGLTAWVLTQSQDPLALEPVLATLSVVSTLVFLKVAQARRAHLRARRIEREWPPVVQRTSSRATTALVLSLAASATFAAALVVPWVPGVRQFVIVVAATLDVLAVLFVIFAAVEIARSRGTRRAGAALGVALLLAIVNAGAIVGAIALRV